MLDSRNIYEIFKLSLLKQHAYSKSKYKIFYVPILDLRALSFV